MNVIARLEYELVYYDSAVHRFNHYTTRTSPSKSLSKMGGYMCSKEFVQPSISHEPWSMEEVLLWWGGFCHLKSRGFAPREEQIESDWLSQHTAPSRDPIWNAQEFLLMQYNNPKHKSKLCQMCIKSSLSTDVLADAISGLKSHWTGVGWTWSKSQS